MPILWLVPALAIRWSATHVAFRVCAGVCVRCVRIGAALGAVLDDVCGLRSLGVGVPGHTHAVTGVATRQVASERWV